MIEKLSPVQLKLFILASFSKADKILEDLGDEEIALGPHFDESSHFFMGK